MFALPAYSTLAGCVALSLCASAGQGYLPLVGPPGVRFEKPRLTSADSIVLPPLPPIEKRPTAVPDGPEVPVGLPAIPDPAATNSEQPREPAPPSAGQDLVQPIFVPVSPLHTDLWPGSVASGHPEMAPQMFFKFFSGQAGTNGVGHSFFMPVGFVPPVPLLPPSSSARFETVPAGKP
jgi:hypothetical protein